MSRCYRPDREGWARRSHSKPHTAAWLAARQRRAERRVGLSSVEHWQPRDKQGFILKLVEGRTAMYDPGPIDRWLWCEANGST